MGNRAVLYFGVRGPAMLRIALFAIGAVVALYLIWKLLQILFGSYRDRRAVKKKRGDSTEY
jgi:hypothetical protein